MLTNVALDYGIEKFQRAVDSLADSIGPWRDRLYNAFLCMHAVRPREDLPSELQHRGVELFKVMTRVEAKQGEGNIRASIDQIDEVEGQKIIHEIWCINDQLQAHHRHW